MINYEIRYTKREDTRKPRLFLKVGDTSIDKKRSIPKLALRYTSSTSSIETHSTLADDMSKELN